MKNRFFLDQELKDTVVLTGTEHHHLSHVMRLKPNETIEIANGKGSLAIARITEVAKHQTTCQILSFKSEPPATFHLHLAVPLMRMSKLELVIEKCTELGADHFHLYPATHSEKEELSEHQIERLHHILISALKQCGRLYLPAIQLQNLEDLLNLNLPIFFGEVGAKSISEQKESLLFISGPEKGFSEKERSLLKKGTAVSLSRFTLRAETAPIAAACLFSLVKG